MISRQQHRTIAHVGPLAVFLVFMAALEVMAILGFGRNDLTRPWYVRAPEQWVYPLQTCVVLAALLRFRREYDFRPIQGLWLAVIVGVCGIAIWIMPGLLYRALEMNESWLRYLGFTNRSTGFNPAQSESDSGLVYSVVVAMRFIRLVVVVPFAEELFWRSFLMRYLATTEDDYWSIPFGLHQSRSFVIVTSMFTLAHSAVDYLPAFVFGSLMYWLTVKTKSLAACVLAHATANLILGIYIMDSGQYGYW